MAEARISPLGAELLKAFGFEGPAFKLVFSVRAGEFPVLAIHKALREEEEGQPLNAVVAKHRLKSISQERLGLLGEAVSLKAGDVQIHRTSHSLALPGRLSSELSPSTHSTAQDP